MSCRRAVRMWAAIKELLGKAVPIMGTVRMILTGPTAGPASTTGKLSKVEVSQRSSFTFFIIQRMILEAPSAIDARAMICSICKAAQVQATPAA